MTKKISALVLVVLMLPLCYFALSVPASAATGGAILQVWNRDGTILYDELVLPDVVPITSMTITLLRTGFEVHTVANDTVYGPVTFDYKGESDFAGFSIIFLTKLPTYQVGQVYTGAPIYAVYVYNQLDVFYADTGSADGMLGELGDLQRPDMDFSKPDAALPDIMGALNPEALSLYMSGFGSFMQNEYIYPILFIAFGLTFVSYVLFGKGSG